jgi:hypothetical protein
VFAVTTLIAFLISPGPSSAAGVTVVEYYSEHGDAAIWQAVLAGFGVFFFVWFAGAFAETMPSGNAVLVSAGAMAAVYLVALGAWEALGETYNGPTSARSRATAMALPTRCLPSASEPHTWRVSRMPHLLARPRPGY